MAATTRDEPDGSFDKPLTALVQRDGGCQPVTDGAFQFAYKGLGKHGGSDLLWSTLRLHLCLQ